MRDDETASSEELRGALEAPGAALEACGKDVAPAREDASPRDDALGPAELAGPWLLPELRARDELPERAEVADAGRELPLTTADEARAELAAPWLLPAMGSDDERPAELPARMDDDDPLTWLPPSTGSAGGAGGQPHRPRASGNMTAGRRRVGRITVPPLL